MAQLASVRWAMSAAMAGSWIWGVWYVTWWLPALWTQRAKTRPARSGFVVDRTLAGVGTGLLFLTPITKKASVPWPLTALWRASLLADVLLFTCMIAGFAFCWWARLHLGRLWSGLVTVKPDHHVVQTGPYRIVRHPIYTGVIAAAAALALIEATPLALAGTVALAIGFYLTARKEEGFLRQELGTAAYDAYGRRTPMLVPLLKSPLRLPV